MDTQQLIEEKVAVLKQEGIPEDVIKQYIAEVLELSFMRTMATKIDSLSEVDYKKMLESIKIANTKELAKFFEDNSDDLNEKIFALQVKEILALR